jgi:TonB-linked SusC/RagA family outer membrane protein
MRKFYFIILITTFFVSNLTAQPISISGKITDSNNGESIPGASVLIEGTTNGVISNMDGEYSINVPNADATIICSFVGYEQAKQKVGDKRKIDFALISDVKALDEVVVVGYGTIAKQNLTTSVSKVKTDDVPKAANNSVNQLLFGRAAGLKTTQQSAEPGGKIDLSIRGRGAPLVVIDGVAYPSDELNPSSGVISLNNINRGGIANINPDDIESIEILKDASAAIYGIGASNGVVLITSKKGKAGKLKVNYDGSRSMVKNMPYLEPLSPTDYMTYWNQFSKDYYWASKNMEPFGSRPSRIPKSLFLYSDAEIANPPAATDWLGQVLRSGSIDNHNINISGGNDRVVFYISGNYFNQIGTIVNSDLRRFIGKANMTIHLSKSIRISTTINATRSNYTNGMSGYQAGGSGPQGYGALQAAIAYPTLLPAKDADGNYSKFGLIGNPLSLLTIKDKTQQSALFANTSLDIDIIPKMLSAKIQYGNNFETALRTFFVPSTVFYQMLYQSRGAIDNSQRQTQTLTGILNFKKNFKNLVNLDILAGYEQNSSDHYFNGLSASGMLDAMEYNSMGAAPNRDQLFSEKRVDRKRSYFTRGNFDLLDRYLVSLTYRYDGIDKFFHNKKYAGFPSASVGWKISKEPFLSSATFIDILKVRASIGLTGDASGVLNAAYGTFSPDTKDQTYFDNGATVYTPYYLTAYDLPNLEWQKTKNTNIGLDFGFYKNRISGSVELFKDEITNLLNSKTTAQLAILTSVYANGGKQVRSGYDISLKTVNVASKAFQWDMIINMSHYQYRWEQRYSNMGLQSYVGAKDPVNAIYVFPTKGIIQIGDSIPAYQKTFGSGNAAKPGCPLFVDKNGDDSITNADVEMYNPDPKLIIGWGNNFRYKNFDLGVFFYSQLGAKDFNNAYAWSNAAGFGNGNAGGSTAYVKESWSTTHPEGTLPGASYDEWTLGLTARPDVTVQSKDFIRCRNITLGYTYKPSENFKYFSSVRIYADVQNAFLITNYKIMDPEVQYISVKGGSAPYPMARTYSFGISLNF